MFLSARVASHSASDNLRLWMLKLRVSELVCVWQPACRPVNTGVMKAAGQRLVCRSRSSNEDKASSRRLWHFCSSPGVVSGSMKVDGGRTWGRAFAADDPRWPSCRSAQTNSVFYLRNKNKNLWIVLMDWNPAPSLFSFSLLFQIQMTHRSLLERQSSPTPRTLPVHDSLWHHK